MNLTKYKKLALVLALTGIVHPVTAKITEVEPLWRGASAIVSQESVGELPSARRDAHNKALIEALELIPFHSQKILRKENGEFSSVHEVRKTAVIQAKILSEKYLGDLYQASYQINIIDDSQNPEAIKEVRELLKAEQDNSILLSYKKVKDPYVSAKLKIIDFLQRLREKINWSQNKGSLNLLLDEGLQIKKLDEKKPVFTVDWSEFKDIILELKKEAPELKEALKIYESTGRIFKNKMLHLTFNKRVLDEHPKAYKFALFLARQNINATLVLENTVKNYPLSGLGNLWTGANAFHDLGHVTYSQALCESALKESYPSLSKHWFKKVLRVKMLRNSFVMVQHQVKPVVRYQSKISYSERPGRVTRFKKSMAKDLYGNTSQHNSIKLPDACLFYLKMEKKEMP